MDEESKYAEKSNRFKPSRCLIPKLKRRQALRESLQDLIPIGNNKACSSASWKRTVVSIALFFQLSDVQFLKQKQKLIFSLQKENSKQGFQSKNLFKKLPH